METSFFAETVLPHIQQNFDKDMDTESKHWYRSYWKKFESLDGIKILLADDKKTEVLDIFCLALTR